MRNFINLSNISLGDYQGTNTLAVDSPNRDEWTNISLRQVGMSRVSMTGYAVAGCMFKPTVTDCLKN